MGRTVTADGQLIESEFVVIEEYADAKVGLLEHAKGAGSAVLIKAREDGEFSSFKVYFYDEF
ncbi:hypothetical protein K435DRAFT_786753 [Dendrothele bispora CBS 962.96]|nr:hypothetical protein K435DRAFT_786753 [Dendrothele bispora CBS 962.96]